MATTAPLTVIVVTTASGSSYEFCEGYVRRVNEDHAKRADGDWVLLADSNVELRPGEPMHLALASLSHLGPDDTGAITPDGGVTYRTTTPVVSIETRTL